MIHHELLDAYLSRQATFKVLGQSLHARLEQVLESGGVKVHAISYRVKDPRSLAHKLGRPDKTYQRLEDITDLIGLRVITYFEDSVDQVDSLLKEHFRVDSSRSVDKRRRHDPHSFGYVSLHSICHPPEDLLREHPDWNWPFEIQIRTILQHAWAEIEHDLGYKSAESVPLPVRRRFSRLAGLLELADSEFVELRRSMQDYVREVAQQARLAPDTLELDTVLLQSLMEGGPVAELDLTLAGRLGRPLSPTPFYPAYVTRMLRLVELGDPSRILKRLEVFSSRLLAFAERYFRFTTEAWGFGAEKLHNVQRGYSLLLLAHWQALNQAGQEPLRLENMKNFYQQIDYPHDEAEARHIARLFVKCFADWHEPSPG
jgi:ppGpp synthetase/RelA/SpoT-type nucleotidyltranferase